MCTLPKVAVQMNSICIPDCNLNAQTQTTFSGSGHWMMKEKQTFHIMQKKKKNPVKKPVMLIAWVHSVYIQVT